MGSTIILQTAISSSVRAGGQSFRLDTFGKLTNQRRIGAIPFPKQTQAAVLRYAMTRINCVASTFIIINTRTTLPVAAFLTREDDLGRTRSCKRRNGAINRSTSCLSD